ncbi:SAM-dependent methyltransferase [Variovorax boronicumulans]|uniref:fused MFS/spermidine synthase n=1 Tax=Variovorax boronicumulans TaxID=436515 RepID=UPI002476BEB6|nr:fused MFS/spermidine synthase [Variovorax boronicumulans]MDH6170121.1 SAM-dependent methyltransferase [Variovorax boronicumulans]
MGPAGIQLLFAGTIFSSAFLLFLVQPLIAKQILPWFGGSAAVWSICMVFFQVVLLAGYAYSDWITRHLRVRTQAALHVALLLASLAFLPIVTSVRWKPTGAEDPTLWILGLLLGTIGLPYFLLSTTGPLVQSWVARTPWGAQVYRYFSLSNLASLLSLLSYPVLIEPRSSLLQQAHGWSWGYGAFVALCSGTTLYVARRWADVPLHQASGDTATAPEKPLRTADYLLWLALPALGSWLLLAVTNHITQNVAAVPFLWVLPLTLYLLTFVLCFESDRWYRRGVFLPLAAAMLLLCAFGLQDAIGTSVKAALPIYAAGLFALCMFLHGEMARLRPGPRYLTRFYLMLSLGGALGGVTVGLVAPHVLPAYYELGIGLVLTALLAVAVLPSRRWLRVACVAVAGCCAWFLWLQVQGDSADARVMQRNFYGTLVTVDHRRDDPADDVRQMFHGSVKHGEQFLLAARRSEPTSYYGRTSGIGRAIAAAPAGPRRVGLIGLGAGTLAGYGRAGDVFRVYEINPQVFDLADTEFSFLRDSPARIERVLGDARLALEREPAQGFDVLAVDAFSGDSVPIHLITAEAMDVYLRHLRPGGIVAFHVTNRFLALAPVVAKIAETKGLHAKLVHDDTAEIAWLRDTDWVLVAREAETLARDPVGAAASAIAPVAGARPWTDDFNNLLGVLK